MRKRCAVFLAALVIGLSVCPLIVSADELTDVETTRDTETIENMEATVSANSKGRGADVAKEENDEFPSEKIYEAEDRGKLSLQIPQKVQVVIDPFDMDGKGQIYSEQYTIWNTGETEGTLTLAFLCRAGEDSGLQLRQERDGIHEGDSKFIYMEMVFDDAEHVVLSTEISEYRAELAPGEGVTLYFTGEINENASEQWKDGDIAIEGIYTWYDAEDHLPRESEEMKADTDPSDMETPEDTDAEGEEEKTSVSGNGMAGKAEVKKTEETASKEKVLGEIKAQEESDPQESGEPQSITGVPDEILNEGEPGKGVEENGKEEKDDFDRRDYIDSGDRHRGVGLSVAPEG